MRSSIKDTFGGSNGLTGYAGTYQDLNPYNSGIDLGFVSFRRGDLWSITVGWTLVRSPACSCGR